MKENGGVKRPPISAMKGHSFNEAWFQQPDEFYPPKLRSQSSCTEPSHCSQQQHHNGFSSDKRSVSLHGFQREAGGPPPPGQVARSRNPISALHFPEQLTPLEQTPRGSMESLALSNATGGLMGCFFNTFYSGSYSWFL